MQIQSFAASIGEIPELDGGMQFGHENWKIVIQGEPYRIKL